MKKFCALTILLILFSVSNLEAQNNRKNKAKKPVITKSKTKKKRASKIISLGVINGKAINPEKPKYPLAAKTVGARGSVNVSILIDEQGSVIEAEAVSGHPLLWAASVSAALKSTFEPVTIGGNIVKVRGLIVYKFTSDTFNWLEIGNAFGEHSFAKMLPFDFEEEKQMYEQYLNTVDENKLRIYQSLQATIENKLSGNAKNLWLFQLGIFLKKLQANHWNVEDWKNDLAELKNLITNSPENLSPKLISNLKNLLDLSEKYDLDTYDPVYGSKISKQLQNIKEHLWMLGN